MNFKIWLNFFEDSDATDGSAESSSSQSGSINPSAGLSVGKSQSGNISNKGHANTKCCGWGFLCGYPIIKKRKKKSS